MRAPLNRRVFVVGYAAATAHGTSTRTGDSTEAEWLREAFGARLPQAPISANKSQIGHSLGATAAIEAALSVKGLRRQILLPTVNHLPAPELADLDVVPDRVRRQAHEFVLSNAGGFGGTNCCVVFKGM